jgi:hypothetical protein
MIYLQIPTIFWIDGIYFCQLLNTHDVNDDRQEEMHTAGPSCMDDKVATEKLTMI